MSIDRIDWHWDSVPAAATEEEHWEKAGAHIGYFMEWAYKNGFAPSDPETNDVEEYQKVANSELTGIQFLIENCDTKFWDVDLSEEGQKFTNFAYEGYLENYEGVIGHKVYTRVYNQEDFQKVSDYLDKVYTTYLQQ